MTILGYLAKLKRGLGLAFGAHFLHDFFVKMFLTSLSMDKVSVWHLLSQDIKQNVLLSSHLGS